MMRHTFVMTLVGLAAVSVLSCLAPEDTINCTFDTILEGTSECNVDETCDLQAKSGDDLKVTITGADCVPSGAKKKPGESCKQDVDCDKGLCMDKVCRRICFDKGWKCGGSETCVFAGWLSSDVKKYKVGYCAEVSACMSTASACSDETECRYLINDNGIPKEGATYETGCTFALGTLGETESCDYSDQCAAGLVCAAIPDLEDSEQMCRPVCTASGACGSSAVGTWCTTNLSGPAGRYKFKTGETDVGVCTTDPSSANADTGGTDTGAE